MNLVFTILMITLVLSLLLFDVFLIIFAIDLAKEYIQESKALNENRKNSVR